MDFDFKPFNFSDGLDSPLKFAGLHRQQDIRYLRARVPVPQVLLVDKRLVLADEGLHVLANRVLRAVQQEQTLLQTLVLVLEQGNVSPVLVDEVPEFFLEDLEHFGGGEVALLGFLGLQLELELGVHQRLPKRLLELADAFLVHLHELIELPLRHVQLAVHDGEGFLQRFAGNSVGLASVFELKDVCLLALYLGAHRADLRQAKLEQLVELFVEGFSARLHVAHVLPYSGVDSGHRASGLGLVCVYSCEQLLVDLVPGGIRRLQLSLELRTTRAQFVDGFLELGEVDLLRLQPCHVPCTVAHAFLDGREGFFDVFEPLVARLLVLVVALRDDIYLFDGLAEVVREPLHLYVQPFFHLHDPVRRLRAALLQRRDLALQVLARFREAFLDVGGELLDADLEGLELGPDLVRRAPRLLLQVLDLLLRHVFPLPQFPILVLELVNVVFFQRPLLSRLLLLLGGLALVHLHRRVGHSRFLEKGLGDAVFRKRHFSSLVHRDYDRSPFGISGKDNTWPITVPRSRVFWNAGKVTVPHNRFSLSPPSTRNTRKPFTAALSSAIFTAREIRYPPLLLEEDLLLLQLHAVFSISGTSRGRENSEAVATGAAAKLVVGVTKGPGRLSLRPVAWSKTNAPL
eukprot:CAMPEP_0178991376 /NCGR_PEP_ID=MMETSP0795-20121207/5491_1 /TAXON_ID=88552 /ORGANISM="Amoebophrya sp., Strain Ameob2" /LENGTH=629 /DNA_ID=CAMNT_0020683073 /DNA_START=1358 /DNA_END=3248 /DNA_ORIENTATION=+